MEINTKKSVLNRKNDRIKISSELKSILHNVKEYLDLLANPAIVEDNDNGIYAIKDETGKIIPGMLRYSTSKSGKSAAILGGVHMNELAGIAAQHSFHTRWLEGIRPVTGTVYIAVGHLGNCYKFLNRLLRFNYISPMTLRNFRMVDGFNYNRIPFDIETKKNLNKHERRVLLLKKYILDPCEGRVLDIHNTSVKSPTVFTVFRNENENQEQFISRMNSTKIIEGLPIEKVIAWKPGPYNNMVSLRTLGKSNAETMPSLIESGWVIDPESFIRAISYSKIWLQNVLGLFEGTESSLPKPFARKYYFEKHSFYHPAKREKDYAYLSKEDLEAAKKDTFILIKNSKTIQNTKGWSKNAMQVIQERMKDTFDGRLNNFSYIHKGDILAIGLVTGITITASENGFILMIGSDTKITPDYNESFLEVATSLEENN